MAKGKRPRIFREEQRIACAGWCPDGATVERRSQVARRGWRYINIPSLKWGFPVWICPKCAARYQQEKEGAK